MKNQFRLHKKYSIFFLTGIFAVVLLFLLHPIFSMWMNSLHHQRGVKLTSNSIRVSFSIPSYLHTQEELQNKQVSDSFTNITNVSHFYSHDKKVNQYYYQTDGIDFTLLFPYSVPYTENVPFATAKKITTQFPSGTATLYIYEGSDGNGNNRGKLGSVHQGQITLDTQKNLGLAFYCYDHSSGNAISARCNQITQLLLETFHIDNGILSFF